MVAWFRQSTRLPRLNFLLTQCARCICLFAVLAIVNTKTKRRAVADFIPVNDDHAVEGVTFQFIFAEPFPVQLVSQFAANHHRWKDELPAFTQSNNSLISVGGVNWPGPPLSSVSFSNIRPDGTPAWLMRIEGNTLIVQCTRYTRWDKVWGKTLNLLRSAQEALSEGPVPAPALATVILAVVDAFDSKVEGYNVDGLLRRSKFVNDHIRSCGPRWHSNQGWFEDGEEIPLLHNLNMSSVVADANPADAIVRFGHQLELRLDDPIEFPAIDMVQGGWVDLQMRKLHLHNKTIINDLLTEALSERILLNGVSTRD